jgi:hypothetical protein
LCWQLPEDRLIFLKIDQSGDEPMKPLSNICYVLLGFALIGALIAGTYFVLRSVVNLFYGLNVHVASVIYASVLAFLFSAAMISLIVRLGQRRRSIDQVQGEKAAVYQCFLATWSSMLNQANTESTQSVLRIANDLHVAEQHLLLWGSNNVIKYYTAYQNHETLHNPRDSSVLPLIEKILQEMRKDLGQSNIGIQTGDLFNLLVDTARHDDNSVNTTVQGTHMAHRLFNGVSYQGAE